jgi:hypothetical protein
LREHPEESGEHETGAGEEVEGAEGGSQAFVVAGQATKTGDPGEASLHDPAAWQKDEAAFGLSIATLAHAQQSALAAAGVLPAHRSQPGGELVAVLKGMPVADRCHESCSNRRAHAFDRGYTPAVRGALGCDLDPVVGAVIFSPQTMNLV